MPCELQNAHSLELGCDCVGLVHYFDAHIVSYQGSAVKIPNAICMHEEDDGIMWKHKDWRTGHTASKVSPLLVHRSQNMHCLRTVVSVIAQSGVPHG